MSWFNQDGLLVKFGREAGVAGIAGEFEDLEFGQHVLEINLDLTKLASTAAILDDNINIPSDYTIMQVDVIATTAATSGGSATLNVGLIQRDRSTNISDTALVSALALTAIDSAGETNKLTVGSTGAGGSIGATPGYKAYVTAKYGTAAFTAGVVKIRVISQKV